MNISTRLATKVVFIARACAFVLCIIIMRLVQLQVIQWQTLFYKSQKNCLRTQITSPLRGNILDCHGQLLATNRPTTNLEWQGSGNRKLQADQIELLKKLEIILNIKLLESQSFMTALQIAERSGKKIALANDITFEQHSQIVEQLQQEKNLFITTHFKRYYPHAAWGCHILGYLGRI